MRGLSPNALKAFFSPESDQQLICLLTITAGNQIIRIADGYTHRFERNDANSMIVTHVDTKASSTVTYGVNDQGVKDALNANPDDLFYGTVSAGRYFIFLPFQISLPIDHPSETPSCKVTMYDVTRYLIPTIRSISNAPSVQLELVLSSNPDLTEASFPSFLMGGIVYNQDSVTAELALETMMLEPFPAHTFTPSHFPGLF